MQYYSERLYFSSTEAVVCKKESLPRSGSPKEVRSIFGKSDRLPTIIERPFRAAQVLGF